MNRRRRPLWIALLVFLVSGCSYVQGYLDIARDKGISKEYLAVLNDWTRSQVSYSQFETQVKVSATFKGRAFQAAYLAEYARIYELSEEQKKGRGEALKTLEGDFSEIFFYAYVPEKDYNDFEKLRSVWSVFLVDGSGRRIEPLELRRIDPVTPLILDFYPYVNPHHGKCYSLKIPAVSDEDFRKLKLVLTGVVGRVELTWK
ncbi:MAG: hypothetical protein RBT20_06625 [Syntrophales bacterium]|jgi:hypothetical protein|nr:hypothetical protein [Syntrophales bacterium]